MMYNAEGEMFQPFIAHKGNITPIVQRHFKDEMVFCQTSDGLFGQSVLMEVFKIMKR